MKKYTVTINKETEEAWDNILGDLTLQESLEELKKRVGSKFVKEET